MLRIALRIFTKRPIAFACIISLTTLTCGQEPRPAAHTAVVPAAMTLIAADTLLYPILLSVTGAYIVGQTADRRPVYALLKSRLESVEFARVSLLESSQVAQNVLTQTKSFEESVIAAATLTYAWYGSHFTAPPGSNSYRFIVQGQGFKFEASSFSPEAAEATALAACNSVSPGSCGLIASAQESTPPQGFKVYAASGTILLSKMLTATQMAGPVLVSTKERAFKKLSLASTINSLASQLNAGRERCPNHPGPNPPKNGEICDPDNVGPEICFGIGEKWKFLARLMACTCSQSARWQCRDAAKGDLTKAPVPKSSPELSNLQTFTQQPEWLKVQQDIFSAKAKGLFHYTGTAQRVCRGSAMELINFLKTRGYKEVQGVSNIFHSLVRYKDASGQWVYIDGTFRQFISGRIGPQVFVGNEATFRTMLKSLPIQSGNKILTGAEKMKWIDQFFKIFVDSGL